MKKILFILALGLTGCAALKPFSPQPGMTVDEVSKAAYIPCDGSMNPKANHLVLIGAHPEFKDVLVYRTLADQKYRRGAPECRTDLFFRDGKLVSIETLIDANSSETKVKNSYENITSTADVIKKLNLTSNNKALEILHAEVTENCVSQVQRIYKISKANDSHNQNLDNAERFLNQSKYKENAGMHQKYLIINKSHPQWYKFQNEYFDSVGSTKNNLIKFTEAEPTSSDVLAQCISSLEELEVAGKKKMLEHSIATLGSDITNSDEYCSVFESEGVKKYAEKVIELSKYANNPLNVEKINLIKKQTGANFDLNSITFELINNGLTINTDKRPYSDILRKNIVFDESKYKSWLNGTDRKVSGKFDYSDLDTNKKSGINRTVGEKTKKIVENFSVDCSKRWKESKNNFDIVFFYKTNNNISSYGEQDKTLSAGLFSGAKEQFNQQGFKKAEFVDNLIASIESISAVSLRERQNDLAKPKNCKNYLASKNILVKDNDFFSMTDSGLSAYAKPNNELRKVTGRLIDLNDKVALIQGRKIVNTRRLDVIDDASGAMLKFSNKTQWYINKDTLVLDGDSIRAYGNYVDNVTQSYTNAFNRVQKVKIPVIDALCVESGS